VADRCVRYRDQLAAYCFGALTTGAGVAAAGVVDVDDETDELLLTEATLAGLLSIRRQWPSRKAPGSIARL
jgi:hypothetical protein